MHVTVQPQGATPPEITPYGIKGIPYVDISLVPYVTRLQDVVLAAIWHKHRRDAPAFDCSIDESRLVAGDHDLMRARLVAGDHDLMRAPSGTGGGG